MLIRPFFDIFGIMIVSGSILLMVFVHNTTALVLGVTLLVAVLLIIYRHYVEMGTNPDVLEYVARKKVI